MIPPQALVTSFKGTLQGGWDKNAPQGYAFTTLPRDVVKHVGLTTHMGARIDLAVLSAFAFWYGIGENREPRVLEYKTGECVPLDGGEFVLSIESIAEDLYERWYGERFDVPQESDAFRTFYGRVKHAVKRLRDKGLVQRIGYAVPAKRGTMGTVWTLNGTWLSEHIDRLQPLKAPALIGDADVIERGRLRGEGAYVNVVDVIGEAFVDENPDLFVVSELVCNPRDKRREKPSVVDFHEWTGAVARTGTIGERHTRVGAWKRGEYNDPDAPVLTPWIVFDIDVKAEELPSIDEVERRLLEAAQKKFGAVGAEVRKLVDEKLDENMEILAVKQARADAQAKEQAFAHALDVADALVGLAGDKPLEHVYVCPTGGTGYHVMLPCGLLGSPVFRDSRTAHRVLAHLADVVTDCPVLDKAVLNPRHLYRLIGSQHPKSGLWKRAIPLADFVEEGEPPEARGFESVELPDPRQVEAHPALRLALQHAVDKAYEVKIPPMEEVLAMEFGAGAAAWVEEAEDCVTESGQFHELYAGRNNAAFMLACHYLRQTQDGVEAWRRLREVNAGWPKPLKATTLKGHMRGAIRATGICAGRGNVVC